MFLPLKSGIKSSLAKRADKIKQVKEVLNGDGVTKKILPRSLRACLRLASGLPLACLWPFTQLRDIITDRGKKRNCFAMAEIKFSLKPVSPFSLNYTLWILRRRPHNSWDLWDGQVYRRVLFLHGKLLEVSIYQKSPVNKPEIEISVSGQRINSNIISSLKPHLEQILGLQIDLSSFYKMAQKDILLRPLVMRFWGFKPTRYPTVFEALVNAITCQQFTLNAGLSLLGRLVSKWGPALNSLGPHCFPRPQDLAPLQIEDLRAIGFSRQKAQAIIELAHLVQEGFDLQTFNALSDEEALKNFQQLRGVGRWTAEYVLLRGLGRIHIFPGDDLGIRRKLLSWLGIKETLDYEGVINILKKWHPFGGLVYFLLLLKGLEENGQISPSAIR